MANSLSFDSTDLGQYGLSIVSREVPLGFQSESVQLQDKAYANDSLAIPKVIALNVNILGTTIATLKTNLDSIKEVLNTRVNAELILDSLSDRYWMARFESLTGQIKGSLFSGSLVFMSYDPFAFNTSETLHEYNIDADPKTVQPTVLGTSRVEPVYTLTAGELLTDITLKVENTGTAMELVWEGTILDGKDLEIDVANWHVTNNAVASMATVSGEFPYLNLGVNSIKVTGFSTTGSVDIVYRKRYG